MGTEKRRILIVEDEKNIAMLLSFNLGRAGFDTDVAEDGEIGLRKALSDKFDIVLLDIMLPKLDGFKVLEGIRTRSDVPVIMVTARDDEKDKILGPSRIFFQQINKEQMLTVLASGLHNSRLAISSTISHRIHHLHS